MTEADYVENLRRDIEIARQYWREGKDAQACHFLQDSYPGGIGIDGARGLLRGNYDQETFEKAMLPWFEREQAKEARAQKLLDEALF